MIKLLTRKEALQKDPFFAYTIVSIQDGKYNPDNSPYQPGEMFETESGTSILTEGDCLKLNKEAKYEFQRLSDKEDIKDYKNTYIDQLTYSLSEKTTLPDYFELLNRTFSAIFDKLEIKRLTFMMDYAVPWLSIELQEKGVKETQELFKNKGMDANFIGAIAIPATDFKEMISLLFWYGRYNDVFPEIYFTGDQPGTIFNICPFSNLHFNCFKKDASKNLKEILNQHPFNLIKSEQCSHKYPEII